MSRKPHYRMCGMLLVALAIASFSPASLKAQVPAGQLPDSPKATSVPPNSPSPKFDRQSQTNLSASNVQSGVQSDAQTGPDRESKHRFWDKENDWLFAGVGASRTLDYFSTLNMRRRGRQEILLTNDVVDNHAAFAVIEASGTGVSIGASYLFHRYNHHKLERWTSVVHLGLTTGGAVRNYCLKTAHPATTPGSL